MDKTQSQKLWMDSPGAQENCRRDPQVDSLGTGKAGKTSKKRQRWNPSMGRAGGQQRRQNPSRDWAAVRESCKTKSRLGRQQIAAVGHAAVGQLDAGVGKYALVLQFK